MSADDDFIRGTPVFTQSEARDILPVCARAP